MIRLSQRKVNEKSGGFFDPPQAFQINFYLTDRHGAKRVFMALGRNARAAISAHGHPRFGGKRLDEKGVGNDADIRAYADEFDLAVPAASDVFAQRYAAERGFV